MANDKDRTVGSNETSSKSEESPQSSTFIVFSIIFALIAAFLSIEFTSGFVSSSLGLTEVADGYDVPPNSVRMDFSSFTVLGPSKGFRNATSAFNPTQASPPIFQIFSREFLKVLGPNPSIRVIAQNESFAFAHEAPIWVPSTDEVFFSSNNGGHLGHSDWDNNNRVSKISLKEAANGGLVNLTEIHLSVDIQMTNGGTPYKGNLLLVNSGRGDSPPNLALINPYPPYNSTVLLDNFFGRQFNSLNDVKIHPKSKSIFFTDVTYGYLQHFRPAPQLPNQVYRFDPDTGSVRVVDDSVKRCNGIAFSGDGKTAYVTDTSVVSGFLGDDASEPATIYAFDVDRQTQVFTNRRVFAYVDHGVPDGINVDVFGNVYSGTGDGIQVWNRHGELIGKIFLGHTSANFAFAGKGRLVVLAETKIYLVEFAGIGVDLFSIH